MPVTGLDLHFAPAEQNYSSHQCLHWWQRVSTGHSHLDGFESGSYKHQNSRHPYGVPAVLVRVFITDLT